MLCDAHLSEKGHKSGIVLSIIRFMGENEQLMANTKCIKRGYSRSEEKTKGSGGEKTYYGS